MRRQVSRLSSLYGVLVLFVCSCASGTTPQLAPLQAPTVAVAETLRLPLVPLNSGGDSLAYRYAGPMLTGLDRTATIVGTRSGAEFRFSPLSSHVGTHTFTFDLLDTSGSLLDRKTTTITVRPASDAGPVFTLPASGGGTFDLDRDPSVQFDIEVRDDDSPSVTIRARGALPDGATLEPAGPKRAHFAWTPTLTQRSAAERWTVQLEANDAVHAPTPRDYVIVLREAAKDGCSGTPPAVNVLTPGEGERVAAGSGVLVRFEASDDSRFRDAPIVYYSTVAPDNPTKPDVTRFEQTFGFETTAGVFEARLPTGAFASVSEQAVYMFVSATDDDDSMGTLCDHRTDTPVRSFVATFGGGHSADDMGTTNPFDMGGTGGGTAGGGEGGAGICSPCSASRECAAGACAVSASGGVCLASCAGGEACGRGSCGSYTSAEGSVLALCGSPIDACSASSGGSCVEDGYEPNDSRAYASAIDYSASGQVCGGNDDYFSFYVAPQTRVDVSVDLGVGGDLDLHLLDGYTLLGSSANGGTSRETTSYCSSGGATLYARVFGYTSSSENAYTVNVATTSDACCVDDASEDDDSLSAGPIVGSDGAFSGTVCPGDVDYRAFYVSGPSDVTLDMYFTSANGDLDVELVSPTGTSLASSRTTRDEEHITYRVTDAGYYGVRVYGYRDASNTYSGWVTAAGAAACSTTRDCGDGRVCDNGSCVEASCSSSSTCPYDHACLAKGPYEVQTCVPSCTSDSACRSGESCKRIGDGRYCAPVGYGEIGDACAVHGDCRADLGCYDAGYAGYCTRPCASTSDCTGVSTCVSMAGASLCARDCHDDATRCRASDGLTCRLTAAVGSSFSWNVCVP